MIRKLTFSFLLKEVHFFSYIQYILYLTLENGWCKWLYFINLMLDFRCTGNSKYNQPFTDADPYLDEATGELYIPESSDVDESSVMVSGMIPLILEIDGEPGEPLEPLWINEDMNSPFAFRPTHYQFQVSQYIFNNYRIICVRTTTTIFILSTINFTSTNVVSIVDDTIGITDS